MLYPRSRAPASEAHRLSRQSPDGDRSRLALLWQIALPLLLGLVTLALTLDAILREPGALEYRAINTVQKIDLPYLDELLNPISWLTDGPATVAIWAAVVVLFGLLRRWGAAVATFLMTAAGAITFTIDRVVVARPRPDPALLRHAVDDSTVPAFPSGHVIGAVMLYGLLFTVARRIPNRAGRLAIQTGSAAVIALVGFSRVWQGAHWASDVIAGYALGALYLIALLRIERRVGAACDGIPFLSVRGDDVPRDGDRLRANEMTSTATVDGSTVSPIVAPGFLSRALSWLRFQAELPFVRRQAAPRATLDQCEREPELWDAGEPRIWSRSVRALSTGFGVTSWPRRAREKTRGSQERAEQWFDRSIAAWGREARISAAEATRLRAEIQEPQFLAVLPHFGVHLTIGLFLRFPIGSITRASYTLVNLLLMTLLFLTRRIGRKTWRLYLSVHSPLVILIAGMPGIGTFAYLASKPVRSHHLLVRVALDAVLLKFPWRVYERLGLRWLIARPINAAAELAETADYEDRPTLRVAIWPQSIVQLLIAVAGAILAAYVLVNAVDYTFGPSFFGWEQLMRIVDLNNDASLANWFAVVLLFVCSTLLLAIVYDRWARRDSFRLHWLALALLMLGFSLDEGAKLHDPGGSGRDAMREALGLSGVVYYAWVIPGAISVIALALIYRRFVRQLPPLTRKLGLVSAALYVGGELGVEMIGGLLAEGPARESLLYKLEVLIEEGMSAAGIIMAVTTLLLYIQHQVGDVRLSLRGLRGSTLAAAPRSADSAESVRPTIPRQTGRVGSLRRVADRGRFQHSQPHLNIERRRQGVSPHSGMEGTS